MPSNERRRTRTMYMHTLDARPAEYDGNQIVFTRQGRYARGRGAQLVADLQQIKREQRASVRWRIAQGWDGDASLNGYVRVEVPR